ncbi:MAG: ZIP family metal transporter [Pseudomonadota bacterium]
MHIWAYTLVSVAIVSLLSLVGVVTLALKRENLKKALFLLVSFAVGGLFGDAFIHLLPESFRALGLGLTTPLLVLMGILLFFILEKFIRWRHCHNDECKGHAQPVAFMNIFGDAAHNLIDGMLIGASYLVSIPIGIATTLAIVLHEIPHELGNFGVLVHGGLSVRKALLWNFLSALVAVAGALFSLTVGPHVAGYANFLLPITAGGFVYVAGSDLIPELHHDVNILPSIWQLCCILLGIGIMALLILIG